MDCSSSLHLRIPPRLNLFSTTFTPAHTYRSHFQTTQTIQYASPPQRKLLRELLGAPACPDLCTSARTNPPGDVIVTSWWETRRSAGVDQTPPAARRTSGQTGHTGRRTPDVGTRHEHNSHRQPPPTDLRRRGARIEWCDAVLGR